jgi:hypothetical protein
MSRVDVQSTGDGEDPLDPHAPHQSHANEQTTTNTTIIKQFGCLVRFRYQNGPMHLENSTKLCPSFQQLLRASPNQCPPTLSSFQAMMCRGFQHLRCPHHKQSNHPVFIHSSNNVIGSFFLLSEHASALKRSTKKAPEVDLNKTKSIAATCPC